MRVVSGTPERRETALAAALLALLLAAVHYDVLFQGRSLVLTNHLNPLDDRSLAQNYGDDLVPAEVWIGRNLYPYANIRDPGGAWWQWESDGEFLRSAMQRREWPFWDPYVGAGAPAMANMTPGYFFPPYTAMIALGGSIGLKNAYFLLLLWAAGFFTVRFLRLHGLTFLSALLGGVLVMMSGALNQHIGTIGLQAAACLPVALFVTRRFLDRPGGGRTAVLAVTYAAIALASFPPILMWLFGITACYAIVALSMAAAAGTSAATRRAAVRWLAATSLSVGLVAFFYVPALTLRASAPYVVTFYEGAGRESVPLVDILQLLSPTLAGGVRIYVTWPVPAGTTPGLPYIGMVAILTALLAAPAAGPRARVLLYASTGAAALIAMKLFAIPPLPWITRLPLLDQIHYAHYFGMGLGFLLAFLAALGLDALQRGAVPRWRGIAAAAVALAATQSLWWFAAEYKVLESPVDSYWIRDWLVLNGITVASAFVLLVAVLRPRRATPIAVVLVALASAEGVFNNTYPSPRAFDIFDHPMPYVQVLQRAPAMTRVLPFGALSANLNSAYRIFSFDSLMTINPPRVYELYRRYAEPPRWLFLREARRIPPEPVLDQAAIGFLAVRNVFPDVVREAHARGYAVRFNDGFAWLFERPAPPRFRYSSDYRVLRAPSVLTALAQAAIRSELSFWKRSIRQSRKTETLS